jgi:hypothetical protein
MQLERPPRAHWAACTGLGARAAPRHCRRRRHQAWGQYQDAQLARAAAPRGSEPALLADPRLSRPTLGDVIRSGQQERTMARWERQQQQ